MDAMEIIQKQRKAIMSEKPDGTYDVNPEYSAVLELDRRLTEAGIPHVLERMLDGWIVCYPASAPNRRDSDAIRHYGSYGAFHDLMEIYGFGLKEPDGWCGVDKAFEYFRQAHEKARERKEKHAERKKRQG